MVRIISAAVISMALVCSAWAEAPREENVQGLYEGTIQASGAEAKVEARLVALGKGTYKLLVRQAHADGKVAKFELAGKTEGEAVKFAGKVGDAEWAGAYADGAVTAASGSSGSLKIKRIERVAPNMGTKPPQGAIVLLDGKNFDEMAKKPLKDGKEQQWKVVEEGAIEVPKGGMVSKRQFAGSFKLHVEFKNPLMPAANGQGRGNSGCYMPNGDEVQVLDSFGMTTYTGGGCGGLYRYKDPDAFDEFSLASLPPLQWQAYDIEYRVEMKDGKPTGRPRITVIHNGIKIHDNVEVQKPAKPGVFHFQDHGNPVHYRNIWVLPLEEK